MAGQAASEVGVLLNNNTDQTVTPATLVVGMMGKNSGVWNYAAIDNTGALKISGSITSSPLSASSSSVSAIQGDAGLLRVSAVGGTSGDNTLVDGTSQTISATLTPVSAKPGSTIAGLVTNPNVYDASQFRVSSFTANSLSATANNFIVSGVVGDAGTFLVSAKQGDSGLFHVSAILAAGVSSVGAASFAVSAASLDAGTLHTSAFVDSGSISAKSGDANNFHVSSVQGDAGLQRVSGFTSTATNFPVSAVQADAGLQHTSAFIDSGSVSARSGDSGQLHVSASIFPDTTGGLTIFSNYNLSSSINVKSTAAGLYGWYAWNTDTKPVYINFYNVSGAINVGTDAIKIQLMLPASAAANSVFPLGIAGFTTGISLAAVSAVVSSATSPGAASSCGINLFYK